ncbi:hypothetical protein OT109_18440 [Phycisphaeraceae bacterium D3-23]
MTWSMIMVADCDSIGSPQVFLVFGSVCQQRGCPARAKSRRR